MKSLLQSTVKKVLFLGLTASLAFAAPTTWEIDAYHSTVGFRVKHMMITNVNGSFDKFSGTVVMDEADLSKSKVNVTIDISSISTGVSNRDEHLKGADFFDIAKFPTMTFVSKSVKVVSKEQLLVTGDLTMHGVTKSVVLNVEGPTAAIKDPRSGGLKRGATATTVINRKDFGLTYNAVLEAGGVAISEEVKITLDLQFNQK